jgi:AraC-like DNA-binding protein
MSADGPRTCGGRDGYAVKWCGRWLRISKEVGYGSVSHFISEFRSRFGVAPRAYSDAQALSRELRNQRDDQAAAPTS